MTSVWQPPSLRHESWTESRQLSLPCHVILSAAKNLALLDRFIREVEILRLCLRMTCQGTQGRLCKHALVVSQQDTDDHGVAGSLTRIVGIESAAVGVTPEPLEESEPVGLCHFAHLAERVVIHPPSRIEM